MRNGKFITRAFALPAFAAVLLPRTSSACAVCMGASDSTVAPAMNAAIFLMLGFIGAMLAGVAGFAFYLFLRARRPVPAHEELTQMIYEEGFHHHA